MKKATTARSNTGSRKTRPLNMRGIPEDLYWACRVEAAKRRITLKKFIILAMEKALKEGVGVD